MIINNFKNEILLWVLIVIMPGCLSQKDKLIKAKNECFEKKLPQLRSDPLYEKVFTDFMDTFRILKENIDLFGIPDYVENKIDNAIFFNVDSKKCMIIVLQKYSDTLVFGACRLMFGKVNDLGKWTFEPNLTYSFANDYFDLFKENSFENISKLARFRVLTSGNVDRSGCEIDNNFWFERTGK